MKRSIVFTLAATVVATIGIAIGASRPIPATNNKALFKPVSVVEQHERNGTIDGAKNPELIPDNVAYTMLFRLIANHQTDVEKNRIRAYVRQMGLGSGECKSCSKPEQSREAKDDKDIDALIGVAEEFQQRVAVLDNQAREIKKNNRIFPNSQMQAQLTALQQQKEAMVDEIIASLPRRLTAGGMEKMRRHVNERVKPKMKMDAAQQHS